MNTPGISETHVILEIISANTWYVVDTLKSIVCSGVDLLLQDLINEKVIQNPPHPNPLIMCAQGLTCCSTTSS